MPKKATCCIPEASFCAKGLIGCRGNHSSNGTQGKDPVACGCCVRQIAMTGILHFRKIPGDLFVPFPFHSPTPRSHLYVLFGPSLLAASVRPGPHFLLSLTLYSLSGCCNESISGTPRFRTESSPFKPSWVSE